MLVVLTKGLTVQHKAISQAAESGQPKPDLIVEFATLVFRVAGEVFPLFSINSPQILMISVLGQDIDSELLHHDLLFMRNSFIWTFIEIVFNRALIIAVGFHFQPVKLDLFGTQGDGLSHYLHPILHGLPWVTKNEFNVDLIA